MFALKRLVAYGIDFLILATILVGVQLLVNFLTGGYPFRYFKSGVDIELWVVCTMSIPVWLYFILCEYKKGQTIGKRIMKIRVEMVDGKGIHFKQAWLRTLIKLLPWELTHIFILIPDPLWGPTAPSEPPYLLFIPNILIILYIAVLFWNRGIRALHDILLETHVVTK